MMQWVLLLFVAACFGQVTIRNQFTCNFVVSQPSISATRNTTGTIKFDWTNRRYQLYFASGNNEVWAFNSKGGYGDTADQYLFTYSGSCPCITSPFQMAQPALTFDAAVLVPVAGVASTYQPKTAAGNQLKTVTFANTGFPGSAVFASGRNFVFSGCAAASWKATDWKNPDGCSCGQPQDVVITWDRSSSITYELFLEQKRFAQELVKGFTYGPLETNLGMVNFHTNTWYGPVNLNQGTTLPAALAGADALACAPNPQCQVYGGAGTCCGSGTCTSCGIVAGADMLATMPVFSYERRNAAKILIVFSDGGSGVITTKKGENPVYDPAKPGVVLGQSGSFSATQINDDLKWAVAYAKRRVPGIQIYAVGAGPAFVRSQLQLICDGDDTRVFASTAWSDILNFVSKLVARTCGVNPSPCTSCCGSCTCSPWCRNSRSLSIPTCNDANSISGDGCDSTCRLEDGWECTGSSCKPTCGDGKRFGSEQCDDGNKVNGDGCSSTCTLESGYICPTPGSPCTTVCGDGLLRGKEQCDDGNLVPLDGCTPKCLTEVGWTCLAPNRPCVPICGDGLVTGVEKCDDKNKVNGDGCSSTCTVEAGWVCPNPGRPCLDLNECAVYGCPDARNPRYVSKCVESGTAGVVPKLAINSRVCTCPPGFVLNGTDQSKFITTTAPLVGNAAFVGCVDVNECTLWGCSDGFNGGVGATCQDSTSSASVPIMQRTCTCPSPGWYARQSTNGGVPVTWVQLNNNTQFTGCMSWCGDSVITSAENCDDGNSINADGCSSSCTVELGWICSIPGLACCPNLPSALAPFAPSLRCWNGWWVPANVDENGNMIPVVLDLNGDDATGEDDPNGEYNDDEIVFINDLKLCGPFVIEGTVIVADNATLTIAGSLTLAEGGNLTFTGPQPSQHGQVNMIDSCGAPGFETVFGESQFVMHDGSSLNINGLDWQLDDDTYSQYLTTTQCIDTFDGDLFMGNASEIPDEANSFPVISSPCTAGDNNFTGGDGDDTWTNDEGDELAETVDTRPLFKNMRPENLPGGCSDIASYYKKSSNGTDIFVQTNKKELCNSEMIGVATFIPFMLAAALAVGAALVLGIGRVASGSGDDYVAL